MEFFQSLTLDLKLLVVAIGACVLLALFSGNRKNDTRYMVVLAVLAAVGIYRFSHLPSRDAPVERASSAPPMMKVQPGHVPLESTAAKR